MSDLIAFTPADDWAETVWVDPDCVSLIKRYHRDRDLGSYSTIVLKNGEEIHVCGLPTMVAEKVRNGKAEAK